ncbi:MAG: spondin domain-containing protein [Vicinamibacterales bacterium]
MRRKSVLTVAAMFALAACADESVVTSPPLNASALAASTSGAAEANAAAEHTYQVTIENLTTGQVFSPGVIATHTKDASVWEVGATASAGIRSIAEDGMEATAVSELSQAPGVYAAISTLAPINRIGGPAGLPRSRTFTIGAAANANRLSVAVMLICTNDGFTGVSSVKLPGGFAPESHLVGAWDAGTEQNNERFNQIVDPCQMAGPVVSPPDGNGRVATNGVITTHANITGVGDLSVALHGWRGPVARITIQRQK